jgi:acetolactate synthase small subunit
MEHGKGANFAETPRMDAKLLADIFRAQVIDTSTTGLSFEITGGSLGPADFTRAVHRH